MNADQAGRGLLLFAHGAREPGWAAPFAAVRERIRREQPGLAVELGFLELMTPDLAGAADALVRAGCHRIEIVPLFFGTGNHLRRDLPVLAERLRQRHHGVSFELRAAIGEHPDVVAAIARAAAAAQAR
ncbi:MAG: CbiX/SirB N-terminal domain-containing protein [Ideonella sp.]|nr:CbiX/SirB N-terminal domain-containing protein [Ideonella sp.]MBE7427346.1 CbiX/SirB N-terminal domain-containing protein [Ideonella sp.]MCC7459382.1 CbiX/SirB N-terminal domain-containing protein [Nitrospira sp.]